MFYNSSKRQIISDLQYSMFNDGDSNLLQIGGELHQFLL